MEVIARWLVTGATGQLGGHVVRLLLSRGAEAVAWVGRGGPAIPGAECHVVDLSDADRVERALREARPTHVLHVGAMTAVGDVYADPEMGRRVNVEATRALAEGAAEEGARMVYVSTDMVFDGEGAPYTEGDEPRPLSLYGRSKLDGERHVLRFRGHAVLRIPLMYGYAVSPRGTTFSRQVEALRRGERMELFEDEFRTPVWLGDAAAALVGLAESGEVGVWHLAGPERVSRLELVRRIARGLGLPEGGLVGVSRRSVDFPEPRPADLSLDGAKFNARFPALAPRAISAIGPLLGRGGRGR